MTHHDRDPGWERDLRAQREGKFDDRATPRQAVWSWVAAVAIVFVLGAAFYGIDAQRSASQRTPTLAAQPTTPVPATTGQGGARQ
jgi:hypothetical protein